MGGCCLKGVYSWLSYELGSYEYIVSMNIYEYIYVYDLGDTGDCQHTSAEGVQPDMSGHHLRQGEGGHGHLLPRGTGPHRLGESSREGGGGLLWFVETCKVVHSRMIRAENPKTISWDYKGCVI